MDHLFKFLTLFMPMWNFICCFHLIYITIISCLLHMNFTNIAVTGTVTLLGVLPNVSLAKMVIIQKTFIFQWLLCALSHDFFNHCSNHFILPQCELLHNTVYCFIVSSSYVAQNIYYKLRLTCFESIFFIRYPVFTYGLASAVTFSVYVSVFMCAYFIL